MVWRALSHIHVTVSEFSKRIWNGSGRLNPWSFILRRGRFRFSCRWLVKEVGVYSSSGIILACDRRLVTEARRAGYITRLSGTKGSLGFLLLRCCSRRHVRGRWLSRRLLSGISGCGCWCTPWSRWRVRLAPSAWSHILPGCIVIALIVSVCACTSTGTCTCPCACTWHRPTKVGSIALGSRRTRLGICLWMSCWWAWILFCSVLPRVSSHSRCGRIPRLENTTSIVIFSFCLLIDQNLIGGLYALKLYVCLCLIASVSIGVPLEDCNKVKD